MNTTPVAIVMGSKSDLDIVQGAFDILDKFGVKFTARVLPHTAPLLKPLNLQRLAKKRVTKSLFAPQAWLLIWAA